MKDKVKDRLITGLAQYLNAQSAGSSRFAVANGYLAIDNYFTALLLKEDINPTYNHKNKLNLISEHFNHLLLKSNISKEELLRFYDYWQDVRYSSRIPSPDETLNFIRLCNRFISVTITYISDKNNISPEKFEEELYSDVLGSRWLSFEDECSYIHEKWQQEAEFQGEMGYGSKLFNKMINPSNFCEILAISDDKITKNILAENEEVGSAIANFYNSFLNLVVQIQNCRANKNIDDNEITNFMFSLKLRYLGQSMDEIASDYGSLISQALNSLNKNEDSNNV